ncbi:MAG: 4-alpha-glucanotransferase, partial [Elusimicrobiota bacterium]|nr:4-alpha-glucanotransferase [Elusimicrobiota bacterium]
KTHFKAVDTFISAMQNDNLRDKFLNSNVIQLFAGKPHIADKWGLARVKELIALSEGIIIKVDEDTMQVTELGRDERLKGRVVFIPNLNVAEAPIIFQGADVLCMWSELETEASATGYMKGVANAIPTIATKTGGPLEHIKEGYNGVFIEEYLPNRCPSPKGLIDAILKISEIYTKSKIDYYKMMWNALQTTPDVDIETTMKKYILELWLPAYNLKKAIAVEPMRTETESGVMVNRANLSTILPLSSLRNSRYDPGIGKLTDLIDVFKNVLKPAGVNILQLLPHFRPSEESPYSPVSVFSINENYIDWVKEAERLGLTAKEIEAIRTTLQEETSSGEVDYERV